MKNQAASKLVKNTVFVYKNVKSQVNGAIPTTASTAKTILTSQY